MSIPGARHYDVAIVGAGVVGSAIARDLSLRGVACALLEAESDVGTGTSKANTAILHTGFDAKPGTLESKLVRRGYQLLSAYAEEVGIPMATLGALLIAWSEEELASFDRIERAARSNGHSASRHVSVDELYKREPKLGSGALGALEIPDEGIICPWTTNLALATDAVLAGCDLLLDAEVCSVERAEHYRLATARGFVSASFLVNAAGLRSDWLNDQLGYREFTVTPRRGELIVFDKLARGLVKQILLPVPTATTKGVLVAPTVFGNVLLGPTADPIGDKRDRATTASGLQYLLDRGSRILPQLLEHEVTATYAGLRAATEHTDYQLRVHGDERYACAGGIRSTGLSASMAIAEHVRLGLAEAGLAVQESASTDGRRMPNIGELAPRPHLQPELIVRDPEYGRIVCFCERVTAGELRDALASPIPPRDLDGLRRRTRALMGRCQGFFCAAHVSSWLAEQTVQELGEPRVRT